MTDRLNSNRWLTLAVVLLGFFMILIDTTVVNVSIPTIIADLKANLSDVEWVISGYALAYAALLITFGRLGDIYGRKAFFMLGLTTFTIASFFSGEASSIGTLIAARIAQGVGGAMLSPAVLSIISSSFRDRERAAAFGAFGAVTGLAVAVGPILGGWLTTYYSWRWVFRINIPIGILGLLLSAWVIRESKAERGKSLDWSGMVTSTFGFFALVFGLIEGQTYGWWKPVQDFTVGQFVWRSNGPLSIVAVSFIISAALLACFTIIQATKTRRNESPAVDFRFFQFRTFRYGLIAVAIIALGEFSSLFTLPIFLQSVHGFTPLQSGYAVLPMALAVLVAAPISAFLVNRVGTKWVITGGISLEAIGLVLLSRMHADTAYAALVPGLLLLGTGIGLAVAQNTQVILSEIDPRESGSGSGVLNTVRQVGTALGIAVIGAVLANQASIQIPNQIRAAALPGVNDAVRQEIISKASVGEATTGGAQDASQIAIAPPAAIANDPARLAVFNQQLTEVKTELKQAVNVGLTDSIGRSISVGAGFVIFGAVLSLFIPTVKQRRHNDAAVAGH